MRRHLPTFTSLLCFESSARHLSFTRAAEELNLTQSAVSRQVRNLEEFLQTDLFHRIKKRLSLTPEGRQYAETVSSHLNSLETETMKLITREHEDSTLNIGTFPTFGSRWLIPKLSDFSRKHPEIQFNLTTGLRPFDLDHQDIDVAIQHGRGDWEGVETIQLAKESVIAVCAPDLVQGAKQLTAGAVLNYSLLHLKTRTYAWPEWLQSNGLAQNTNTFGPTFETFSMMVKATLSGLGVAVIPTMFVEDELREGRLIAPFSPAVHSERGYYLVHKPQQNKNNKISAFIDWIGSYL